MVSESMALSLKNTNVYAEKYSELYRSVPYDDTNMMKIAAKIAELISTKCSTGACENDHVVYINDVVAGIKLLKCIMKV